MTPEQIDRVFGRGRLKMLTGAHVEVFREAAAPGESRRYTKRFLTTEQGDYAQWTEREWRILARLIGHGTRCVPDVVQYDRDARGTKLVQTYDAGATVDQWATLLPLQRDGHVYACAFEDCAHWWALAHHCLAALDEIHSLQLVHLDVKGDNICIPIGPANFDPADPGQRMFPVFRKLALIDFAFSLVSGETLTTPLPIGWQQDYDYQSPRLLHALEAGRAGDLQPTEDLDWRCDMYSLAAMLKRYLPGEHRPYQTELAYGWTAERYDAAKSLILRIREAHDRDPTSRRPHAELIAETSAQLGASEVAQSLESGWMLARDAQPFAVPALPLTPITRLAPPIRLVIPARDDIVTRTGIRAHEPRAVPNAAATQRSRLPLLAAAAGVAIVVGIVPLFADTGALMRRATQLVSDGSRAMASALRELVQPGAAHDNRASGLPAFEPQGTPLATTADATGPVGEAAGGAVKDSADGPANPAASTSAPASGVAAAIEGSPAPAKVDSPRMSPQSRLPSTAASSQASPQASPADDSLAAQIEAYRAKPTGGSTPSGRPPSSSTQPGARASNTRSADATRRPQPDRATKSSRPAASSRVVASRARPPVTSKRTGASSVASAPARARAPGLAVAPPATPSHAVAVVQPSASLTEAKTVVANAPNPATTLSGSVAQAPPSPPSTAQTVAAPPPGAAAISSISPPVEPQRATPAPSPVTSNAGMAPIVEPPRTFVAPVIPGPGEPALPRATQSPSPREPTLPRATETPREPQPPPAMETPREPQPPRAMEAPREPPLPRAIEAPRSRPPVETRDDSDHLEQAQRLLASVVPRTSALAYAQVARVLWVAANAHDPAQERGVIDAAALAGIATEAGLIAREIFPRDARRLHEEARRAYWSRRHVPEALDLALKAFGANPHDPEIAGNLALLHLNVHPAQPERARQLALHAIGMRTAQYPALRAEDWTTFAIASALSGRRIDARHALYASLALTRNLDRSCRTAVDALGRFGDRMREPVEALLYRLHAQGRVDDSPYCVWPPSRIAGWRYQ